MAKHDCGVFKKGKTDGKARVIGSLLAEKGGTSWLVWKEGGYDVISLKYVLSPKWVRDVPNKGHRVSVRAKYKNGGEMD